jgi:hypothetical protein
MVFFFGNIPQIALQMDVFAGLNPLFGERGENY